MPPHKLLKLLVVAAVLGLSAARAGADDYGIAKHGPPAGPRGVPLSGTTHAPVTPQGADDYGIA